MKFALFLLVLLALSCTNAKKAISGGTSEETNAIAAKLESAEGSQFSFEKPYSYFASVKDGAKLSAIAFFEISAWIKIDSMPQKSDIPHNLVGKFSADSSSLPVELSLALVNGACGSEVPAFAFFLTEENYEFTCDHAVLSKRPVEMKKWIFVRAKWDGQYLTLYQDGIAVATEEKIMAVLPFSDRPVYLGKSGVRFAINKLSLNTEGL